jgi:hypothetical protein
VGLEEGLTARGVDFLTLPMIRGLSAEARKSWLCQVARRCQTEKFDQIWVEVVHSEWDDESLGWLAELAPKRVGFLMESLSYDEEGYSLDPRLRVRQSLVENRLEYLTHLVAVDEADVSRINESALTSALWWPADSPGALPFVLSEPNTGSAGALLRPTLWNAPGLARCRCDLRRLLVRPDQAPEDAAAWRKLFDSVNRAFAAALEGCVELMRGP